MSDIYFAQIQQEPDKLHIRTSKFKELVRKQILVGRLEKIRQQHMSNLTTAMDDLKKQFEDRSQEAKERLVCGLHNLISEIVKL